MYYGNAGTSDQWSTIDNPNLTGSWSFEEGTGTVVADSSESGNHGALVNVAVPPTSTSGWTDLGKLGKGINFDVTNDAVNAANPSLGSSFTIAMWVKPSALATNQNYIGTFNGSGWLFRNSSVSNGRLEFYNGATSYTTSSSVLQNGVWQYIAVTLSGGVYRMYHDGQVVYTSSAAQGAPSTGVAMTIGRAPIGGDFGARATLDEVRIYNNALSADWITTEYNNQNSPSTFSSTSTEENAPPATAPNAPTALNATSGSTQIGLTWTTPASDG
jgi:hypothetical protein